MLFLLTKPKNITLFVFKIFADWQKTDLGKLALSQLDSFSFEAPAFNGLSNDPFSNTHEMTNNDILDYQSKLGYRYDSDMGQNKELPMEDPFVDESSDFIFKNFHNKDAHGDVPMAMGMAMEMPMKNSVSLKSPTVPIRYFKVKSYVVIVVPYQASGHFDFRICYPSENRQPKCKSGEIALFGDIIKPKTKSVPINKDNFRCAKALISNDDSRKINVGLK